jgi:hypothetical protein
MVWITEETWLVKTSSLFQHSNNTGVLKAPWTYRNASIHYLQNLAKEPDSVSVDGLAAKKGFQGRKLGAWNMEEGEAMGVKGDKKGAYLPF